MVQDNLSTPPIGLAEIACLLGARVDIGSVCTSENINMWSKYKPIRSAAFGFDDFEKFAAECRNHRYGLVAPWKTNAQAVIDSWDGDLNGWIYELPNERSQYRLTDFMRYNHKAVPPVDDASCTKTVSMNTSKGEIDENGEIVNSGATIRVWFSVNTGDDEKSLMKLGDLIATEGDRQKEIYLGVIGVKSGGNGFLIKSGNTPFSEESADADFEFKVNSVGTYNFYPVLFDSNQSGESTTVGNICALPKVSYVTCKVNQGANPTFLETIGGGMIYDFQVWKVNDTTLKYRLEIYSLEFSAEIDQLQVNFRLDSGDDTHSGEYRKNIGRVSFSPSEHFIIEETVQRLSPDVVANGVYYFTFQYGTINSEPIYAGLSLSDE